MHALPLEDGELQELVRKSQEGDTEAFGALYDRFFDSIYRYTAFRLPKEIAEDITADIFVKAWEKLYTYRPQRGIPFGAWLFRIARYSVIDAYRTHRGFEEVSEALPDTDTFNRAEDRLERKDTLRIVRAAMDKLPRRYREILLLSFMGELPHSEVAKVLRISEGSVRILKMRALRKLEGYLPPEMGFDA
jgi:RNA polymerase sigma-70 factor, ECF subfamily